MSKLSANVMLSRAYDRTVICDVSNITADNVDSDSVAMALK